MSAKLAASNGPDKTDLESFGALAKQLAYTRRLADQRNHAGMLLVLGALVTIPAVTDIIAIVGPSGTNPTSGVPLNNLIAAIVNILWALGGLIMGLLALMNDWINTTFGLAATLWTFTAFYVFGSTLYVVGLSTTSDPNAPTLVPDAFDPTPTDVRFVGAMAFLGLTGYAATLIGGVQFTQFAILGYQDASKVGKYSSSYYRGRLKYYGTLVCLAGLGQFLLGVYSLANFGSGPYQPPVFAFIFLVTFPEISITSGIFVLLHGVYTWKRALMKSSNGSGWYQAYSLFTGLLSLILQQLVQIGYQADTSGASNGVTPTCFLIGLSVFPVWVESRIRLTPDVIEEGYYEFEVQEPEKSEVAADSSHAAQVSPDVA